MGYRLNVQNVSLINPREVDHLPRSGAGLFLSIPHAHNPQPSLTDPNANYLNGPPPSFEKTRRGEVNSKVYGIWVDRGRGIVVSLAFLLLKALTDHTGSPLLDVRLALCASVVSLLKARRYYPFNFGKHVGPLGWLGHRRLFS